MSRSRRRVPVLKDGGNSHKEAKQYNNRLVRRTGRYLPAKGNYGHRYFGDWMVECQSRMTRADAIRAWEAEEADHVSWRRLHDRFGTLDRWLDAWRKAYLGK